MTVTQVAALRPAFDVFCTACRRVAISDQDIGEWMLSLSVRFLSAHGVSKANIHTWVERELVDQATDRALQPLVKQAAADFGAHKVLLPR